MFRFVYKDQVVTVKELSEMSGISAATIRDRIRRGYTIEQAMSPSPLFESVVQFIDASHWEDWIGMSINDLYEIYWGWCLKNDLKPMMKQGFSRQLFTIYPWLTTVPTKKSGKYNRILRVKS